MTQLILKLLRFINSFEVAKIDKQLKNLVKNYAKYDAKSNLNLPPRQHKKYMKLWARREQIRIPE